MVVIAIAVLFGIVIGAWLGNMGCRTMYEASKPVEIKRVRNRENRWRTRHDKGGK